MIETLRHFKSAANSVCNEPHRPCLQVLIKLYSPKMPPRLHLSRIRQIPLARFGSYVVTFVVWFPTYIFFADYVYSLERVTGRSMSPNFCPDPTSKDYILAKHWNATKDLQRGQVVMFRYSFSSPQAFQRADNIQLSC